MRPLSMIQLYRARQGNVGHREYLRRETWKSFVFLISVKCIIDGTNQNSMVKFYQIFPILSMITEFIIYNRKGHV